jgi:beta-glucosidase
LTKKSILGETMTQKHRETISQMRLDEKATLCSGLDAWHTKSVERLGIPSIMVTDGPHGLRKEVGPTDQIGNNGSLPATCFPAAVTTANSFDRDLMHAIGAAIGEEAKQEHVAVVLGPGVNIKRSPLCGRNFEYLSEDPYVAGEMAAALIQGIQSQGVGTSLKHFACNNQERARLINDSIVDERALREIYLPAFETAIKKAQPWTMMCAYNKINGTYACDHEQILTSVARDEWGFKGAIMSDWGAIDDRVWALKAGLDLEMPYSGPERDNAIIKAVKSDELDIAVLNRAVLRLLELVEKHQPNANSTFKYDITAHDMLARQALCESAVLLKNDGILPVTAGCFIAVIGEFARVPRYQGAGSSKVNPHKITSAIDALEKSGIPYEFSRGYALNSKENADELITQAEKTARGKDAVLIFAGLPDEYESEGFDRSHLDLPIEQNRLIERIAAINPNVVVILHAGSSALMPWLGKVRAVLFLGLGGQCVGPATIDLLLGRVNPSGKLTETFPLDLADVSSSANFGCRLVTQYRESIYVGYRYYDKARRAVLFPFGHGLSYTQFAYSDMRLSGNAISEEDTLTVRVKIKNVGSHDGKEVVQLYVAPPASKVFKPEKELRNFIKVFLKSGEEKEVLFVLGRRAFAYWNVNIHDWHVESGKYEILVGSSSRDICCHSGVEVRSSRGEVAVPSYRDTAPAYYELPDAPLDIPVDQFEVIYGSRVPSGDPDPTAPFTLNSTLSDVSHTVFGKFLLSYFKKQMAKMGGGDDSMQRMMDAMLFDFPLRAFTMGSMTLPLIEGIVLILNRKYGRGMGLLLKTLVFKKKQK